MWNVFTASENGELPREKGVAWGCGPTSRLEVGTGRLSLEDPVQRLADLLRLPKCMVLECWRPICIAGARVWVSQIHFLAGALARRPPTWIVSAIDWEDSFDKAAVVAGKCLETVMEGRRGGRRFLKEQAVERRRLVFASTK